MNTASAKLTPEQRSPLEQRLPLQYPNRLKDMALTVYACLLEQTRPADAPGMHQTASLTFSIMESLSLEHGGENFYMMSAQKYRLALRDSEMMGKFNGTNAAELAKEYGVSDPHFRRLVAAWYKEKRQPTGGQA